MWLLAKLYGNQIQKNESNKIVNIQMNNTLPRDLYFRVNKIVDLKQLKTGAQVQSVQNDSIEEPKPTISRRETVRYDYFCQILLI